MTPLAPRILLLADTDSRVAWVQRLGRLLARELYARDDASMLIHAPLEAIQRRLFNFREMDLSKFDVIVLGLGGGAHQKFCVEFNRFFCNAGKSRRPFVLAGFNGICDPSDPNILFSRTGADIVLANCKNDLASFEGLLSSVQYHDTDKVRLLGYVVHDDVPVDSPAVPLRRGGMLLFVGQPDVPRSLRERCYAMTLLLNLAKRYPDWIITIKPRSHMNAVGVTHAEFYFYQEILRIFFKDRPSNVRIDYRPIGELLDEASVCATVGSTIAIEAIGRGVRTVVVSDFGVRRDYGNHHFLGSGCLSGLAELDLEDKPGQVNPAWIEKHISFAHDNVGRLCTDLREMLSAQKISGACYPLAIPVYREHDFSYLNGFYAGAEVSILRKMAFRLRAYAIGMWRRLRS